MGVPNSVRLMVAVSDASSQVVLVSLLESRNSAVPMAVAITLDKREAVTMTPQQTQWMTMEECSFLDFERRKARCSSVLS